MLLCWFKSRRRGFTLVEFLFVAFTLALFMTALFKITRGGLRAYQRGVVQTELKHELRNIMDRLTTDIRQALPGSFTSPTRSYSSSGSDNLTFRRYKYTADNTIPDGNVQVVYSLGSTQTIDVIDGGHFNIAPLTRAETISGSTTTITLSDYAVTDYQIGLIKVLHIGTQFSWARDPINLGQSNLDVMGFRIMLLRTHSGSTEPETIKSESFASLRTSKDMTTGSNYYPPTVASDPYTNVQRFGNPTSLKRP